MLFMNEQIRPSDEEPEKDAPKRVDQHSIGSKIPSALLGSLSIFDAMIAASNATIETIQQRDLSMGTGVFAIEAMATMAAAFMLFPKS